MKITKRQLNKIIKEELAAADVPLEAIVDMLSGPAMGGEEVAEFAPVADSIATSEAPHPEDYDATRVLLDQNPEIVDLGVSAVMDAAGTSCERSTKLGIVDHLQDTLDAPEDESFSLTAMPGLTEARLTKRQLRRVIQEEISAIEDRPLEIEAEEDAWAGGECLVEPIDHQEITTGVAVEPNIEIEKIYNEPPVGQEESYNRMRIYRGQNDLGRSHKVTPIVLERYYDAMVCGRLEEATDILESHLDTRFPGWQDYEWLS